MKDEKKTKTELVKELKKLRRKVKGMEKSEAGHKETEKALRESEARYRLLADYITDVIWTTDMNLNPTYFSPSVTDMLGYAADEMMSMPLEGMMTPESLEIVSNVFKEETVIEKKKHKNLNRSRTMRLEFIHKNGSIIPAELRASFIRNKNNRAIGVVGATRDITEHRKAEQELSQSEEKYRSLVEKSPEGFYMSDRDGNIIFINQALQKLLGYSEAELTGRNFREFVLQEDTERLSGQHQKTLRDGKTPGVFEFRTIAKDGRERLFITRPIPIIRNEMIVGFQGMLTDITEHKKLENKLQEYTENLEKIVAERTDELEKVNRKLQSEIADRRRAEDSLRESEKRYRGLFEDSRDAVYISSRKGRFLDLNKSALDLFEYTKEELLSLDIEEIYADPSDRKRFQREIEERGAVRDFEVKLRKKNGTEMDCLLTSTVRQTDDGNILGYQGIIRDITERKRAEESLRIERNRAQRYLDVAAVALVVIDADQKVSLVNKKGCEILEYDEKDIVGKNWFDNFLPEKISDEVKAVFKKLVEGEIEGVEFFENPVLTRSGKEKIISWHNTLLKDEQGNIQGTLSSGEDITDCKRAEESLRESEARYKALFDRSLYCLWVHDFQGRFMDANQAALNLVGLTKEELKSYSLADILDEDQLNRAKKRMDEAIRTGATQGYAEYKLKRKDGTYAWVETEVSLIFKHGKPYAIQGIARDITDRKHAEEDLQETEERYKALFDRSLYAVFVHDLAGKFLDANQAAVNLLGYSRQEILSMNVANLLTEDQLQKAAGTLTEIRSTGSQKKHTEYKIRRKDGEYRWVDTEASLIYQHGKPFAIQGIARDITDRKQADEALRSSEERFRRLAESSLIGLSLSTMDNKPIYTNPALLKICGYSSMEEIISTPIEKLLTPETFGRVNEILNKRLRGEPVSPYLDISIVRRDGEIRHLEVSVSEVKISGEKFYQSVFVDVTDRKKMEEELLKAQRLESIGILAGGIAHDFNNFLMSVMGNISLAMMRISPQNKAIKNLDEAERICIQARDIIKQLLTFSKGGAPIKKTASITDIIRDSAEFALRGSNVKYEFYLPSDTRPVEVDVSQINQVIHNLIINAAHAMPEGGLIQVSAKNIYVASQDVMPLQQGEYIEITIKDQGRGVKLENIPRIFDPYFTTKEEGYGLGLTITYSIIKRHGGYIQVESQTGTGTTFKIYLPASSGKIPEKTPREQEPLKGQGKILIMDNDTNILKVVKDMLESLGYEAQCATDGQKLIEIYQAAMQDGKPFNTVLMDLTVPGAMGGKHTINELIKIDPQVKAIVSSGYSTDPIMAEYKRHGFKGVIAKPYKINELSEIMHKVINEI